MQKRKFMRVIAVTSVAAMMVTSVPVMAAGFDEISVLDEQSTEMMTSGIAEDDEQEVFDEDFAGDLTNSEAEFDADDEWLDSGIIDFENPKLTDAWFGSTSTKTRQLKVGKNQTFSMIATATDNLSGARYLSLEFKKVDSEDSFTVGFSSEFYKDGMKTHYPKGELHVEYDLPGSCKVGTY